MNNKINKQSVQNAAVNQLTFQGKMIELIVQVGHHISSRAALTEEVDPPDEVRDHLAEGVAVLESVLRMQHAFVQNRPQLIPPVVIPGRR